MKPSITPLPWRHVHLDFHNSEHIPGIGAAFDADDFAQTFQRAQVQSVTLFAKCHHGWSYYPSEVVPPHPQLARPDLLGEMVQALHGVGIANHIYVSAQFDERIARVHPEWRVMSAGNQYQDALPGDASTGRQLSPAWHTICLAHAGYRALIRAQIREVATRYATDGIFVDIVSAHGCVCAVCLQRMLDVGLDPQDAADRRRNDEAVNALFRRETSGMLAEEFPGLRIFYNGGHIEKAGRERYADYTHLELESLPTGGWGYDHFPSSARYAATLGLDMLAMTGKFHTSWGEFGGFKHPQALEYEVAQMLALGAKVLVGDQLHPSGRINPDTYRSLTPAFARAAALQPLLEGAQQVKEIAILSAEHMNGHGSSAGRNHPSDDGAVQMMLELKRQFDVVDRDADFAAYAVVILPDELVLDPRLAARLRTYVAGGGSILASGRSAFDALGAPTLHAGIHHVADGIGFDPSYIQMADGEALDPALPAEPFVLYADALRVQADDAEVLAEIRPPYFNRDYRHFCSHLHTPDDPAAASPGPAVTLHGRVAYIAYPIFRLYREIGQPLYKALVRGLLARLAPPLVETDLPSAGRVVLSRQAAPGRHVLHLLFAAPQQRGNAVPGHGGTTHAIEMIEDVPVLGPVRITLRLPAADAARIGSIRDALSGEARAFEQHADGRVALTLPRLHIHTALVIEPA